MTARYVALHLFAVLIVALNGCGIKPTPVVPVTVTADQVLQVIEKRAARIRDFSGRAYAVTSDHGENQDAIVYINYRQPDRYRAILKGAFGVVLAVVTGGGDSVTVYVPSLKGYFVVGNDDSESDVNPLSEALVPGMPFDFSRLTSLFKIKDSKFKIKDSKVKIENSKISIERAGNRAVVTVGDGAASTRYTVEGPDLLLVEEESSRDGGLILQIGYRDYADFDGIPFPRKITIAAERNHGDTETRRKDTSNEYTTGREVTLDFSSCSINRGLADSELTFELPPNADRLTIKK